MRVPIATQILTDLRVLLLDESSSGQDGIHSRIDHGSAKTSSERRLYAGCVHLPKEIGSVAGLSGLYHGSHCLSHRARRAPDTLLESSFEIVSSLLFTTSRRLRSVPT